jgi:hypothetical protein
MPILTARPAEASRRAFAVEMGSVCVSGAFRVVSEGSQPAADGRPRARECPRHGLEGLGTWADGCGVDCRLPGPWRTKSKEVRVPRRSHLC